MKIKIKEMSYEDVLAKPVGLHRFPRKPGIGFRTLLKLLSASDLKATNFRNGKTREKGALPDTDEPFQFY